MKISDYVSVVTLAIAGTVIAYFVTNSFIGDPVKKKVVFEYIEPIGADVIEPDSELFNSGAINPTVEVYVGSCVDKDRNGVIDQDEQRQCGQQTPETSINSSDDETNSSLKNSNGGLSDEQNEAINKEQGYASGTTAEQRQEVENSINSYAEQQQQAQTGN